MTTESDSATSAINNTGTITDWGWDYGLTDPVIASPFPDEANWFNEGMASDDSLHWTIAIESEDAPGASAPGPVCQSFPITDVTDDPAADPGVATVQWAPYGSTGRSINLKADLYDNPQPAGAGYYTWYAFGVNTDQGGGALPPPNLSDFSVNLLYNDFLPDAGARVSVDYQGWWNNQSFEIEIDLNRQGDDWGTNSGALVQGTRTANGLTFVQVNGAALGLSLIPGVETNVRVDWGSLLNTLIAQGTLPAPIGGWTNSASQAFYVSTELDNQAQSQSGSDSVWINSFDITSNTAPETTATAQAAGDTMFSVTTTSAGTVETDDLTGNVVRTLPATTGDSLQFLSINGVSYGTNETSAKTLGLNPALLSDYNGNPIGATGTWDMMGLASVQPGAAPSYILVDPTTGRWAEVAVQSNDTINYQNYGDNGNTRVVGIYIDPLVTAGVVVAGSPTDSQTRFLADVKADNLSLLGSLYDQQNGGMDLMFGVNTMPGVFLRAILFPDGNIQYANYVTAAQLTQWAAGQDIAPAIYGKWVG